VPLVRRALKVLTDREVSPQLGLLKSTLLQLDSTFSERTYGAGSFRDFAQKLAAAGHVTLREAGRNVLVELAEGVPARADDAGARPTAPREPVEREADAPAAAPAPPASAAEPRVADGIREVRRLFQLAQNPPRWPMYIRQAKQFLRNVDASFDERKFGFASLVDLMRACQREGLFRIERDRQGVMRIFPGNVMQVVPEPVTVEPDEAEEDTQRAFVDVSGEPEAIGEPSSEPWRPDPETTAEPEVVDGDVLQEMEAPQPVVDGESEPFETPPTPRRRRTRAAPRTPGTRKTADGAAAPRSRKTPGRARPSRTRTRKETPSE
jgi:OST-HTH/LOTUS domain